MNWPALMRAGLGRAGLRPAEFWALTPLELMLMLGLDAAADASLPRGGLVALMARFPDPGDAPSRRSGTTAPYAAGIAPAGEKETADE